MIGKSVVLSPPTFRLSPARDGAPGTRTAVRAWDRASLAAISGRPHPTGLRPATLPTKGEGSRLAIRRKALPCRHCERQRSNPSRRKQESWIASSLSLLAITADRYILSGPT